MKDTIYLISTYCIVFLSISVLVWMALKQFYELMESYEKVFVDTTSRALIDMFVFMDPKKLFRLNIYIVIYLIFIGYLVSSNPMYILLWAGGGVVTPRVILWYLKKRRIEKFSNQLIDALGILSNGLRSGMSFIQALETLERETVPPVSQEFGLVIREYSVGVHLEDALENLAERIPDADLKLIVSSSNVVLSSGGNLVELFEKMAHVIRERRKLELKIKTLTAQGKLQGWVVGFLPTVLGGMMYLLDPLLIERMFTTTIGNIAIGVMLVLQFTGYIMIKKITTITY